MRKILMFIFLILLASCAMNRIHRMGKQYVVIKRISHSPDSFGLDYARVYLEKDSLNKKPYFIYVPSRFKYKVGDTLLYNFEYYDFLTN